MTAYLITWKEEGWPHVELRALVDQFAVSGAADEPWRFKTFKRAKIGDRIFALKQGPGPKTIFGAGYIAGPPDRGSVGGKIQGKAPIRFDALVDPRVSFLVPEDKVRDALGSLISSRSSGMEIPVSAAKIFERCIKKVVGRADWKPTKNQLNQIASQTEIERSMLQRIGQNRFREMLLRSWNSSCAITGIKRPEFLRAAHIKPWAISSNKERFDPGNGILLSPNLDIAFEHGYISIDKTGQVIISKSLDHETAKSLGLKSGMRISGLTRSHAKYLSWHLRNKFKTG